MRKCPSCGYNNAANIMKCGICGRDISSVPVTAPPSPKKDSYAMLITGLLLIACGVFFFIMQNPPVRKETPPVSAGSAAAEENSFTYDGVLYGLEKMAGLKFLSGSDKLRVTRLLSSPDPRVQAAALKLIGAWSRDVSDPERRRWFEVLLETAEVSPAVISRSMAASEAGTAIALGFPAQPYMERVKKLASSLAAGNEADLKAAGFSLAALAGLSEFEPGMLDALAKDPSAYVKLYAACGLSRLGREEGHAYLFEALSGGAGLRREAISCSAFSASPRAAKLLAAISVQRADGAAAEAAKRSLILRKQLAIIKK